MIFRISCIGGALLFLGLAVMPPAGVCPVASELGTIRAGAWEQCSHFGPGTGNCTTCPDGGTTKCDISRPNARCVAYENNTNCLACKLESTNCPGNRLDYPQANCMGTATINGCCPNQYDKLIVASCAEVITENPKYTCPPAS